MTEVGGNIVTMASLLDTPAGERPNQAMFSLISSHMVSNTGEYYWNPKDHTNDGENIHYVPRNSCAQVTLSGPGYLATGTLNGCTAYTAVYRDEQDYVHSFLGHYDAANERLANDDGNLLITSQLARFVGEQSVKVVIAYSKEGHHEVPKSDMYDPQDYPIQAMLDECSHFPDGSSVLLVPYQTSAEFKKPVGRRRFRHIIPGHMLYAGVSGSYNIDIGWNGHSLDFGQSEKYDEARLASARLFATAYQKRNDDRQLHE